MRYLSIYDGARVKEKLAQLPPDVKGIVITFFTDDCGLDQGYTKHGSKNKFLGMYLFLHLTAHSTTEKCVLLIGLCQSDQVKKYGYEKVFPEPIKLLNKLLDTKFKLGEDDVQCVLAQFIGDSLCMNPLAGLPASFTPHITHPCRQCEISQKRYKEAKDGDEFVSLVGSLRVGFNRHGPGVTNDTPLKKIKGFDVGKDLPGDIWHNFHGGCAKEAFGIAIKSLLKKKKFSLQQLQTAYKCIILKTGRHKTNPVPPFGQQHWMGTANPSFQGSFEEFSTTIQLTRVAFRSISNFEEICTSSEYCLLDKIAKLDEMFNRNHITEEDIVEIERLIREMYQLRLDLTRNNRYDYEKQNYEREKTQREVERRNSQVQKRKKTNANNAGEGANEQSQQYTQHEESDEEEEEGEEEGRDGEADVVNPEEEGVTPPKKPRLKPPSLYNPTLKPKVCKFQSLNQVC